MSLSGGGSSLAGQTGGASGAKSATADAKLVEAKAQRVKADALWSLAEVAGAPPSARTTDSALSQDGKFLFPHYLYRAISKRDAASPSGILWSPDASMMTHERDYLRKLAVEGVAHGNQRHTPFLHFTTSLVSAYSLLRERSERYLGQVVRIDTMLLEALAIIDLSTPKCQRLWLSEEHGSKHPVSYDDLAVARKYVIKDLEVLYMAPVRDEAITYVDPISGEVVQDPWRPSFTVVFRQLMCRLLVWRKHVTAEELSVYQNHCAR